MSSVKVHKYNGEFKLLSLEHDYSNPKFVLSTVNCTKFYEWNFERFFMVIH